MKLLCLLLLLASTVRPQAIRQSERYRELIQEAIDISGARLADHLPLQVLDVGTGTGEFMPRIKEYLEKRGYEPTLMGIDIYGGYLERRYKKEQVVTLFNRILEVVFGTPDLIHLKDIHDMMPQYAKHFDLIFINAPNPMNHLDIIKASLPLMKEDGSLLVRYATVEYLDFHIHELYEFVKHSNYSMMKLVTKLPRGSMELSPDTYVLMRNSFVPKSGKGLFEIIGGARLVEIVEASA